MITSHLKYWDSSQTWSIFLQEELLFLYTENTNRWYQTIQKALQITELNSSLTEFQIGLSVLQNHQKQDGVKYKIQKIYDQSFKNRMRWYVRNLRIWNSRTEGLFPEGNTGEPLVLELHLRLREDSKRRKRRDTWLLYSKYAVVNVDEDNKIKRERRKGKARTPMRVRRAMPAKSSALTDLWLTNPETLPDPGRRRRRRLRKFWIFCRIFDLRDSFVSVEFPFPMVLGLSSSHALVKSMDRRWRKTKSVSGSDRSPFICKISLKVETNYYTEYFRN